MPSAARLAVRAISALFAIAALGAGALDARADPQVDGPASAPAAKGDASSANDPDAPAPSRPAPPKKPRRGGIMPCMTPDPGWGSYEHWSGGLTMGQVLLPKRGGVTKSGGFDLIIHFHGHEPVRKEFVKTAKNVVLVGIDLGIGSGAYSSAFSSPDAYKRLVASVEAAVAKHANIPEAHVRKLALSSWSAGYGATEMILRQTGGKGIDSVILLDSLHDGYVDENAHSLKADQIEPFVAFAKQAAAKHRFMFQSHSSIIPPGYASTTEVAHYIEGKLGGKPRKVARQDVLGLDMIERFDKGNYHVRGYEGDDKPDHCAHIGLMADIVRVHLAPRWKTPSSSARASRSDEGSKKKTTKK
jgi:hypothetical protein